ncbi:MAG TPA: methyl-accepting chemotaxis protein [Xanthobacteraceae bacterium]|jgi:methyl-accepting chemotaxis protein
MLFRHIGFRHRIIGILAGGALVAAAIVGFCLHELSALQSRKDDERLAERRGAAIHEAAVVILQAATTFSSLALDLNDDEKKQALADGESLLRRFLYLKVQIAPLLNDFLSREDRAALAKSVSAAARSWTEIEEEIDNGERDELLFHLVSAVKHTDRVRELILKADAAARRDESVAVTVFEQRAIQARRTILAALAVGMLVLLGFGWIVLHFAVKRPLDNAIAAVRRIADGDIASPVPAAVQKGEIGAILSALNVFRDNGLARARLEDAQSREAAERDARRERLEGVIAEFRAAVVTALGEATASVDVMRRAAQELMLAAADAQAGAARTTTASREVSANVADVASAATQMSESINDVTLSVEQAGAAIDQAATRSDAASRTIGGLSETAQAIGQVASFIDAIARQTNLLALNATIEAARAGATGRGFAVVATEVKSLAAQTAGATEDIARRIEEVRRRTSEVVETIHAIDETNSVAARHAETITGAVSEQNDVAASISQNIKDAAGWTADLSGIVAELAAAVDRTKIAASEVQVASDVSAAAADKFSRLVDHFLDKVRAA